jgi:hypothetical protein
MPPNPFIRFPFYSNVGEMQPVFTGGGENKVT